MASAIALLSLGLGILIALVGGIMFLIAAYEESLLWALGCLLFAPAQLIFLIMYWDKAKKSFFVQLTGGGLILFGLALGVGDLKHAAAEQTKSAPQAVETAPAPAPAPRAVIAPPPDTRTRAERILGECASELGLLCSGKKSEKAQMRCLSANEDSLRGPCRAAINEPVTP